MRDEATAEAVKGQLLDRATPQGYLQEWTERIARPLPREEEVGTLSVLVFRIGTEWLALPTALILEVAEVAPIRSIPRRRGGVLYGLVSVRGEILVCASLGYALGISTAEKGELAAGHAAPERLLVTGKDGRRLVFPVHEVLGVHRYHPNELLANPDTLVNEAASLSRGILSCQGRMVVCLDEELVLYKVEKNLS